LNPPILQHPFQHSDIASGPDKMALFAHQLQPWEEVSAVYVWRPLDSLASGTLLALILMVRNAVPAFAYRLVISMITPLLIAQSPPSLCPLLLASPFFA